MISKDDFEEDEELELLEKGFEENICEEWEPRELTVEALALLLDLPFPNKIKKVKKEKKVSNSSCDSCYESSIE